MIHAHAETYKKLSPVQAYALWSKLHQSGLVTAPPDPRESRGEVLAEKCEHLSHAEVVMSIADRPEPFWCSVLDALLTKPVYLCARGETSIPVTDIEGNPLPMPIGHRRGEPAGTGDMPKQMWKRAGARLQYTKRVDHRVIKSVIDYNPKSPGSKSYDRFALYRVGMTVSEFIAVGGLMNDIRHDTERGYIVVDVP